MTAALARTRARSKVSVRPHSAADWGKLTLGLGGGELKVTETWGKRGWGPGEKGVGWEEVGTHYKEGACRLLFL